LLLWPSEALARMCGATSMVWLGMAKGVRPRRNTTWDIPQGELSVG
jgi:hypothetical protein